MPCASPHEVPCNSPIADFCFKCGTGICEAHIFECRQCGNKMCHKCWTEEGKDLCPACNLSAK